MWQAAPRGGGSGTGAATCGVRARGRGVRRAPLFHGLEAETEDVEPQQSDGELIGRILAGEREVYARLVGRYQDTMYRHAAAMVGDRDAAADLVQDTFVKAFTRLDTCDPDRFAAWLFRILRNRCKDWLKNRRQHTVSLADDAAPPPWATTPSARWSAPSWAAWCRRRSPASPPPSARPSC